MTFQHPSLSRRHASEKHVADTLLGDFRPITSAGFKLIQEMAGCSQCYDDLSRNLLLSLATVVSTILDIQFPRNFSRRKSLIVKWFDINYDRISPIKNNIRVEFKADSNQREAPT